MLRKAGRKGKGSQAGRGSGSPDTQVKGQRLSVASLLKTKQSKHWRLVDNSQDIFVSSLLKRERRMKKRGSRASAISSNSR